MASLNKVFLLGNLTRDPETRYTPSGAALCNMGLAVNRRFVTSAGQDREETCFVDIEVWGKQAESCQNYLRKGVPVVVEGRLRYDQWDDRETGKKRSKLLVTGERVQFLGPPARGGDYGDRGEQPAAHGHGSGDAGDEGGGRAPESRAPESRAPESRAPESRAPESRAQASPPPPFPASDGDDGGAATKNRFDVDNESVDDIPF